MANLVTVGFAFSFKWHAVAILPEDSMGWVASVQESGSRGVLPLDHLLEDFDFMQNRQNGRRRRGGSGGGNNPRPMGMASGGQGGSNRLEVRVRGNASQLLEKYKVLARDAHQAGDRVATEYYLQHADHYFRVLNDSRIRQEEMRSRRGPFDQLEEEYDDEGEGQDDGADGLDGGNQEDGDRTPERNGQDRNGQDRGQERGNQERGQDSGNRRPRDDRRYEARSDRPQRDGQREYQAREGQAREGQARDNQTRDNQGRENQGRDNQARDNQARPNGNRYEGEARQRQYDGEARQRNEGSAPRSRYDGGEGRNQADERAAHDAESARLSDGEAALAAFGGVPPRTAAFDNIPPRTAAFDNAPPRTVAVDSVSTREPVRESAQDHAGADDAAVAEAPAPRKRGRPRKVDAAPVAEG